MVVSIIDGPAGAVRVRLTRRYRGAIIDKINCGQSIPAYQLFDAGP